MKLLIVAVGHKMPPWVNAGFEEYSQRMPRGCRVELRQIKPATRAGGGSERVGLWLATEADRIRAALPAHGITVVLDERGEAWSTRDLASRIERWKHHGSDIAFVIGGADGTAQELRRQADVLWALSRMTLPHGLCRVILAEQLYRAVSLSAGHPYHRE